jgi:hypothetical protein
MLAQGVFSIKSNRIKGAKLNFSARNFKGAASIIFPLVSGLRKAWHEAGRER